MKKPKPLTIEGAVTSSDELTRKLVPFDVPPGTTSVHVAYSYTGREHGNAIDLGLLGVNQDFRGYSGGSKTEATVAVDHATPGYIPGLIQPGEWYVLLGVYSVKTLSTYRITIELDDTSRKPFKPSPAPTRSDYSGDLKQPPGVRPQPEWLKGDLHMHTIYSDGHFTLDQLVAKAQKRGLDFIFSTEHNTFSANLLWGKHVPAGFLVGRGIEVTTLLGHWNALGLLPDQYIDPVVHDASDPDTSLVRAVEDVHRQNGLAIINHPFAECKCCSWEYSFHDHMDAIEVWNGPWRRHAEDESNERAVAKWDELLREGRVFAATGGSDIHEDSFEIAEPLTRVLAEENSVQEILKGIRRRRVYLTQHPQYDLEFSLHDGGQSAGIGEWLEVKDKSEVRARVKLQGFPEFEARVITDAGTVYTGTESEFTVTVEGKYVRLEVRDKRGYMLGMTNPIWIMQV